MSKYMISRLGLMIVAMVMIIIANVVGYGSTVQECSAGVAMLCAIGLAGLYVNKFISRWVKLPSMLFVALIGLLLACPLSPVGPQILALANKTAFMGPGAALGAYSGIAIGKDFKEFAKAGWKYVIVTIFVIAGTFFFSALVAQFVLKMTGAI